MPRHLTMILAALALLIAPPAQGADFALEQWLAEPDVKLVAVEFYADWCQPCKAAAPKWEALRKKYASQGLKLVVVNISEKGASSGRCTRLPWNPDESLCDPGLGEELGVTELPEAFVWSWQGNLLVERGQHVGEIEAVIRRYLDDNPRVQVVATNRKGKPDRALQRRVEAELGRSGKLTVVPDQAMRRRLAEVRRQSRGGGRRDDQRCKLGAEVSANSLLTVERFEGAVSLTLSDAATGCQRASGQGPWDAKSADKSIQKAMFKLMNHLTRRTVEMPAGVRGRTQRKGGARNVEVEVVSGSTGEWQPEQAQFANVTFTSEPPGARVTLDGDVVCPTTPCKRDIEPGRHQVGMVLDRHAPLEKTVRLESGQIVGWSLQPTYGTLKVTSTPSGATVTVDGQRKGVTPIDGLQLDAGQHTVAITDQCHEQAVRRVTMPPGKSHAIDVPLRAHPAGLRVRAVDARGDSVVADVLVDGASVGQTPRTFKVSACAREVEVRHPTHGTWTGQLSLRPRETATLQATLQASHRAVSADQPASSDASMAGYVAIRPGAFIMGSPGSEADRYPDEQAHSVTLSRPFAIQAVEVTQGQWAALFDSSPSRFQACGERCPVESVGWWDAVAYVNALSVAEGLPACYEASGCTGSPGEQAYRCASVRVTAAGGDPTMCSGYRLPTEAEWEYAARSGTSGARYGDVDEIAWFADNASHRTHPVGEKEPNAFGLYDMIGNVLEWTSDGYGPYPNRGITDPIGPPNAARRVFRGGGWFYPERVCRAASRNNAPPDARRDYLGFRPARTLPSGVREETLAGPSRSVRPAATPPPKPAPPPPPPPPPKREGVSDADCARACGRVETISINTFAPGLPAGLRKMAMGRYRRTCMRQCKAGYTHEMVDCIVHSKTAAGMAACQSMSR